MKNKHQVTAATVDTHNGGMEESHFFKSTAPSTQVLRISRALGSTDRTL